MSSATQGAERESFINLVLGSVVAPPFRVGTGDITSIAGVKSGQVDIVIENYRSISFPMQQGSASRLYLAEGVCAVIEVKSSLSSQWKQVEKTATALRKVRRKGHPHRHIPIFAIGFTGPRLPALRRKCRELGLAGILVIDKPGFHSPEMEATGPFALYAFLLSIESFTSDAPPSKPLFGRYTGHAVRYFKGPNGLVTRSSPASAPSIASGRAVRQATAHRTGGRSRRSKRDGQG